MTAGVRLRAHALTIHTVAAGGGSICRLRWRADAGGTGLGRRPAGTGLLCNRGGPLTVTDCNLMLGQYPSRTLPQGVRPDR